MLRKMKKDIGYVSYNTCVTACCDNHNQLYIADQFSVMTTSTPPSLSTRWAYIGVKSQKNDVEINPSISITNMWTMQHLQRTRLMTQLQVCVMDIVWQCGIWPDSTVHGKPVQQETMFTSVLLQALYIHIIIIISVWQHNILCCAMSHTIIIHVSQHHFWFFSRALWDNH